jgi:hypothetical protein
LRPLFYASRALSQSEKNYSATALEALCVAWSLELFRPYLGDSDFKVLHHALVWLFGQAKTTKQTVVMMRWVLRLQAFDFEVKYRPGETNKVANALSRYPQLAQRYHLKGDVEPLYAIEAKEKASDIIRCKLCIKHIGSSAPKEMKASQMFTHLKKAASTHTQCDVRKNAKKKSRNNICQQK